MLKKFDENNIMEIKMFQKKSNNKIVRNDCLANNVLIIDGLPGCGKTLFSNIFSSYERVELLSYAFEVEFICRLHFLEKIEFDASIAMVNNLIDTKLYNTMMSRDVNFRYNDLSSVFNYPNPMKYFKRLFQEGDMKVPQKINEESPILNITTHDLLSVSLPVQIALEKRLTFVEVVRHPLFMLIQQFLNLERLFNNPRDIQIHFEYKKINCHILRGVGKIYLKSSNIDRTIFSMFSQINLIKKFKKKYNFKIITIPFEIFVKQPDEYLLNVKNSLKTKETKKTKSVLKKQRVPRKNIVDGLPLDIYKRCGWQPPQKNLTENDEFKIRRSFALERGASKDAICKLDEISEEYNKKYLIQ